MEMRNSSLALTDIETSLETLILRLIPAYIDDPVTAVRERREAIKTFLEEMRMEKQQIQQEITEHAGPITTIQQAEVAEMLSREFGIREHCQIPPKRSVIDGCIAWLKSPQNSYKKDEVVNKITIMLATRCVTDNTLETVSFQSGNANQGWSDPYYKTAFYIYEGKPYLITGNKIYTFSGYNYSPITWDAELLSRYRVLVKRLVDIEHELSEANLGVPPVLGSKGHDKIIESLCQEGVNYFIAQQASIVAGFMLERELKERGTKGHSLFESALSLARHFLDQKTDVFA